MSDTVLHLRGGQLTACGQPLTGADCVTSARQVVTCPDCRLVVVTREAAASRSRAAWVHVTRMTKPVAPQRTPKTT